MHLANELVMLLPNRFTIRHDLLVRVRNTDPQANTRSRKERQENLHGCFLVPNTAAVPRGLVVLLDDVTTTGATLREAAKTLRHAGAPSILGLVAASA
jgi:predicted amidophosphoribosyltransferase